MQFDISYDFKQPVKFLSALEKRLSRKRDILQKFAQIVTWNVRHYIQEGETPLGPIPPTEIPAVILEGKGNSHPLIWTGDLLRSITYVLSAEHALVGSPLKYAEAVRRGGVRSFRRRVIDMGGGEQVWIPRGIVYESGIGRYGTASAPAGVRSFMEDRTWETHERNYLVVTQQDADDLMQYLWEGVISERA